MQDVSGSHKTRYDVWVRPGGLEKKDQARRTQ